MTWHLLLLMAGAAFAPVVHAMPEPPPTEWRSDRIEGPAFFCANGMGVALRTGESLQLSTRQPWAYVQLGPLSRIRLSNTTIEVQWPQVPFRNGGPAAEVYLNARLSLTPISRDMWALSLEPGRHEGEPEATIDEVLQMVAVRFPVGEQASEGLEFARRLEFVDSGDPRCTAHP